MEKYIPPYEITDEMLEFYPEMFDETNSILFNPDGPYNIEYDILLNSDVPGVPYVRKT